MLYICTSEDGTTRSVHLSSMTATREPDPSGQRTVRDRIVAATLGIIAEEGLDAVRHRRVAERAGVSLGSTSYHFESRDDLIEAAFLQFLDNATAVLDDLFPSSPPALGTSKTETG